MSEHDRYARACPGHLLLERSPKRSLSVAAPVTVKKKAGLSPAAAETNVAVLFLPSLGEHLFQDLPADVFVGQASLVPPPAILLHLVGGIGETLGDFDEIGVGVVQAENQ